MITSKKLTELHEHEDEFNKEMAKIDFNIKQLKARKEKLRKQISRNMKYRNLLINEASKSQ
jgi:hypothetical protein